MFKKARQRIARNRRNKILRVKLMDDTRWKSDKAHEVIQNLPAILDRLATKTQNSNRDWAQRKAPDVWATVYAASLGNSNPSQVADEAVREYMKRVRKAS